MIRLVEGNLLEAKEKVIVHQVNCQGEMGGDLATQIRLAYPRAYKEYKDYCNLHNNSKDMLGNVLFTGIDYNRTVASIFGQYGYGTNKRQTNYIALMHGLLTVIKSAESDFAIPYKLGCGKAGGDWQLVLSILEILAKDYEHDIVVYSNSI